MRAVVSAELGAGPSLVELDTPEPGPGEGRSGERRGGEEGRDRGVRGFRPVSLPIYFTLGSWYARSGQCRTRGGTEPGRTRHAGTRARRGQIGRASGRGRGERSGGAWIQAGFSSDLLQARELVCAQWSVPNSGRDRAWSNSTRRNPGPARADRESVGEGKRGEIGGCVDSGRFLFRSTSG